ncbi:MAG TPA: hypothetical protein DEB24_05825 [Coriobacteriia bacterium]|nr:hypothetical protein [Coriobacteriia bacterium]
MFFKILKKDLARKKSMNIILFIFIALCTLFLSSSLSNVVVTSSAIEHFAKVSNASDYTFVTTEDEKVTEWLKSNDRVESFARERGLAIASDSVTSNGEEVKKSGGSFLFTLPKNYNLVLDKSDEVITEIKKGECALSYNDVEHNELALGDKIRITQGGVEKELTLTHITKDMLFGSPYMGTMRIIIDETDYRDLAKIEGSSEISLFSLTTDDVLTFEQDLLGQGFMLFANFDSAMLKNVYILDMVIAAILIVVSVILMLIALVILRFTIAFTLQEDYREIGVMKAIGLTNLGIKRLYMSKYLVLSLFGAGVGVVSGFAFGTLMTRSIQNTMAIEAASANPLLNITTGIAVVFLVLLFCYLTMRRVDKLSAVQAMRSGATGENYKTRKLYSLNKHPKIPTALQMALNDILCNGKNYVALVITFVFGVLMIVLPLGAINTLKSEVVIEYFGPAYSDTYITKTDIIFQGSREAISSEVKAMERLYGDEGIDVDIHVEAGFMTAVYLDDPDKAGSLLGMQAYDYAADGYRHFTAETAPLLKNEVALTYLAMERLGAQVGDTIHVVQGGTTQEFIITAGFESMEMMGYVMRFSETADVDYTYISNLFTWQANFVDRENIAGQIAAMKKITPDYRIQTAGEYTMNTLGSIVSTIDSVKNMIVAVVLVINCLITVLLMRSFITREAAEIALLKSIGFKNATLRTWQALRIIIVLVCSIVLGTLLSLPLNPVMAAYTFGIMGAGSIDFVIVWQEVFVLYPLVLLAVTSTAAVLSTLSMNRFGRSDLGNVE